MKAFHRYNVRVVSTALLFNLYCTAVSQDLDPRAYLRTPVHLNSVITGFTYSNGDVVTDPTLPIKNIKAQVQFASLGYNRTFSLFGLGAQALVVMPWSWAQVSGEVNEQQGRVTRSGLADMRARLSVLWHNGKAVDAASLRNAPRKTLLGASINISAPTGQFFSDKLVNIGTNRWSFRPEMAISQPIGKKWIVDFYPGVWFFTTNSHFYPGNSIRKQKPLGTLQGHISYNFNPLMWVAFNMTYYTGGTSSINDDYKDDRQSNFRVGITGVFPTGKKSSIKLAASTGAIVRVGQDFSSYSISWNHFWLDKGKKKGK